MPLPGDTSPKVLAGLIEDVAALAVKLRKPLAARLLPIRRDERRFVAAKRSESQRRLALDGRRQREEARRERMLLGLESDDGAARARAVRGLEAEREKDLARLRIILEEDTDAAVRALAAEGLAFAPSPAADEILLAALDDTHPAVVASALESLSWRRDPSLVQKLAPFLMHPDERVRTAASEAIDDLE